MKQLIQDLQTGRTSLLEVPVPTVQRGQVLIRTHRSLVSLGTERMLVEFGRANWLDKARQQPEKVRQVLDKIKTDGLQPTIEAVFRKLGEPLPLGYCNAGEVIATGEGVTALRVGDRVASNGWHAEVVSVPQNLVAKIPDGVSYDEAAFTVIGAVALQGIRLIQPTFGETVVVTGLGLIGLVAAQLLQANGCRVIGLDFDPQKVALAKTWGVHAIEVSDGTDPVAAVAALTHGIGADAVLITASTQSNDVIAQAARMSRKRGRIVLVGVVGLNIQRSDFFEKELTFQVSCSYGPGRYDEMYEQRGHDYPIGFVRWTEQRNFEAVLAAMASGRLQVQALITEIVDFYHFEKIYDQLSHSRSIASLLRYDASPSLPSSVVQRLESPPDSAHSDKSLVLGIIGAGNFTASTIVPTLAKLGATMKYIVSAKGLSGTLLARKYGIGQSTTDYREVLSDPEVTAVLISTRHHAHAAQITEALQAGKHVFVEKPLALHHTELEQIKTAYSAAGKSLLVGFNRRFSPYVLKVKKALGSEKPLVNIVATMNAGYIPPNHWTQDMTLGGGRIIGEACHLIDLIAYLADSPVERVLMSALGPHTADNTDNATLLLELKNGSRGTVHYFANGSKAYPKERIEIHSQGRTAVIDNFRKVDFFGFKNEKMFGNLFKSKRLDKGHFEQFRRWIEALNTGAPAPISFESLVNTSHAALAAIESLRTGGWVEVP